MVEDELLRAGRLTLSIEGPVATITLNAPERRNAQIPQTWAALAHIGAHLTDRGEAMAPEGIRAVVIRGAGESFSSGLDRAMFEPGPDSLLGRLARQPAALADQDIAGYQSGFTWLGHPDFISIAAVQGHAVGAGFQLALACDMIIAADDARFTMAEATLGLVPDLGGSGRLVRAVGTARALEICATGRRVGADEAVRIGLALMSVPRAELDDTVHDLVSAVTAGDAETIRAVTRLVTGCEERSDDEQLAAERHEQIARLRALATGSTDPLR